MDAINKAFLIASATFAYWSCHTKYPIVTLVFMCIVLVFMGFHDLINQFGLLDEIDKLKEEIQIKSSEKPQVKAVEKAQDTKEPEPRKDQVKDQAATINCVEVGQKTQVTKESEEPKQQGKLKAKDGTLLQEKKKKSIERWKYCLGFAEKGYKHPYKNPICGAAKFRTFYVGNLSFKASSKDIQQAFEKQLLMKVDSVLVARDSTGKNRGCAFVTMRWKELHDRNPGIIETKNQRFKKNFGLIIL